MTSSTLIVDYLGQGLAAARPATPNVPSSGISIYAATDSSTVSIYFNSTWTSFGAGSGITQLTGDVTAGPGSGSQAATIANNAVTTAKINANAVTNAKLAQMAAHTFKGNNTGATADPLDLTAAQLAAELTAYFPGSNFINAVTKTADYTIVSGDAGASFDNIGASGDITLTLPAASMGQIYRFAIYAAHYIKIQTVGSDIISVGTTSSATTGYIRSNTLYSYLIIEAHGAGRWVASTIEGKWNFDGSTDTIVPFIKGSTTTGNVPVFDSSGNLVDGGVPISGGTVTSVAATVPGGFAIGGSPVTSSGTLAISASGTIGGVLYYPTTSTSASSGALTANEPVIGGGSTGPSVGSRRGNTTVFATGTTASVSNGHLAKWDASGNLIDSGYTASTLAKLQAQWVSGAIVANGTVWLSYKAPFAGTIDGMDYFTGAGSFTTAVKINGTSVTSLSAVAISSATPASTAATGANTFVAGDTITAVQTGATSSPTDALLNINITRS